MNAHTSSARRSPSVVRRILLALALTLGLAANAGARPADAAGAPGPRAAAPSGPAAPLLGATLSRTTGIRVAALGMVLALFIIMRSTKY